MTNLTQGLLEARHHGEQRLQTMVGKIFYLLYIIITINENNKWHLHSTKLTFFTQRNQRVW